MERYELQELYSTADLFKSALETSVTSMGLMLSSSYANSVYSTFISYAIYKYFYEDKVHYEGEDADEVKAQFIQRLGYDVAVKFPYWKTKYDYILKLFTPTELSLLQSSKMISESHEDVKSAGGVIQKSASTPTGVNTGNYTGDSMEISAVEDAQTKTLDVGVVTDSFAEKYTNYQGKTSTGSKTSGDRNGEVLREGSIEDLLKILEKLPSSFADEITKECSKHFELLYSF